MWISYALVPVVLCVQVSVVMKLLAASWVGSMLLYVSPHQLPNLGSLSITPDQTLLPLLIETLPLASDSETSDHSDARHMAGSLS
jgi:hypothetical protein